MPRAVGCRKAGAPPVAQNNGSRELDARLRESDNPPEKDGRLNFVERLLGISPDSGSGLVELLLLAIPVWGLVLLSVRRRSTRQPRS